MLTLRRRTRERTVLDIEIDRILAGERAASRQLYPTTSREVMGVHKEAPARLVTDRRVIRSEPDERTV